MTVSVTTTALADLDTDLLLLFRAEGAGTEAAEVLGETIRRAAGDFSGKEGEALLLYPDAGAARRVGLVGLGEAGGLDAERLRRAAAEGAALASKRKAERVALAMPDTELESEAAAQALVEGFMLAAYRFRRYKTEEEEAYEGPQEVVVQAGAAQQAAAAAPAAEQGRVLSEAVWAARDLVNLSPHEKTARRLAERIQESGAHWGYDVEVWDKTRIASEKMGGLLAVNRGSEEPPTFSILTWRPEEAVNERPIVLVGKGVVFDTGGLSLKPTKNSMDQMKADMAGAAAVVGAFEAIARLELPLHVVGLIPATDNRPGRDAYVPGDVLRMHSGATVEVLNTDAEGRLILADALSHARSYAPELVVDLATLTGAAVVALGSDVAAVMTSETDGAEDRLAAMIRAGRDSGDRVHPLPMFADYRKLLDSDVADLKNVGGREAGSITAGKFLEHFTDYPWIHVDIAGPAFLTEAKPYRPKGGTGFGVRLLIAFLERHAERP